MSTEQNKALARQLVEEVINQGNVNLVDALWGSTSLSTKNCPPVCRLAVRPLSKCQQCCIAPSRTFA